MNIIDFVVGVVGLVFLSFSIASLWLLWRFLVGDLIAIVLLAAGVLVAGGVGDGPWPPSCVPRIASQGLFAAFFRFDHLQVVNYLCCYFLLF